MIPYNEMWGQKGKTTEGTVCFLLNVVCVYFALFTFERIFVLELHQSNQDTLTARFVLSCGQQLPSSCCSAVSMACLILISAVQICRQPLPMQRTMTALTSAPFSFSVQCFHRSSQPEVKLLRESPVYFYWYFLILIIL